MRSTKHVNVAVAGHAAIKHARTAAFALLILLAPARAESLAPLTIVVADFDYSDTSGEIRDQQAEHAARLQAFARAIRTDLAQSGKYRVIDFICSSDPCSAAGASTLIEDARKAGARLVLYGGIHKMSTLIQHGKFQMLDLDNGKLVLDRLISFRGDSDEAWERAERFLARELLQ